MISVICVYNDEKVLRANLLSSLRRQDAKYELILVDNTKGTFKSLPKALNYGGNKAKGEYLMFVHQDVELMGDDWLRRAEGLLASINDLGVAGVAGVDFNGNPVGFIIDRGKFWGSPLKTPKPVMTLDEQLIIMPRKVFSDVRFHEGFKWHSWRADVSLRVCSLGLKAYVLPLPVSHNSSTLPILKAGRLEEDDLKLLKIWGRYYPIIYKTTGAITLKSHDFKSLRGSKLYSVFRFMVSLLRLNRYRTIYGEYDAMLDVVVPLEQPYVKRLKSRTSYSVGIASKSQYLLASKRSHVHDDYVCACAEKPPFRMKSFDLVLIKGCLEYMRKREGERTLSALEDIGCRIVVWAPNNGLPIDPAYRHYRSVWCVGELKSKGYKVYGSGLIVGTKIRKRFGRYFNYVTSLISWYLPQVSSTLIAIKKNIW